MQRIPLLLLLLCLAGTSPAGAQLQVRGIRDLQFGSVVAGIPNAAPPADPLRSGEFEVQAKNNAYLLIIFTLPSQLDGPAGAAMPISFSSGDAVWIGKKKGSTPVVFDPRPWRFLQTDSGGKNALYLGGQVDPASTQRAGTYANTVTLTVVVIG
jgi:hypothetical protein